MHAVEALLAAGDATGDPALHQQALEIARRIIVEFAEPQQLADPRALHARLGAAAGPPPRPARPPVPAVRGDGRARPGVVTAAAAPRRVPGHRHRAVLRTGWCPPPWRCSTGPRPTAGPPTADPASSTPPTGTASRSWPTGCTGWRPRRWRRPASLHQRTGERPVRGPGRGVVGLHRGVPDRPAARIVDPPTRRPQRGDRHRVARQAGPLPRGAGDIAASLSARPLPGRRGGRARTAPADRLDPCGWSRFSLCAGGARQGVELDRGGRRPRADKAEIAELSEQVAAPDLWDDPENAQRVTSRLSVAAGRRRPGGRPALPAGRPRRSWSSWPRRRPTPPGWPRPRPSWPRCSKAIDALEVRTLLSGEYDEREALVTIRSEAGGIDAADFAAMLLRMYLRWAERHRYSDRGLRHLLRRGGRASSRPPSRSRRRSRTARCRSSRAPTGWSGSPRSTTRAAGRPRSPASRCCR